MKEKFIIFVVFALFIVGFLFFAGEYKTIECNIADRSCKTYNQNYLIKRKTLVKDSYVNFGSIYNPKKEKDRFHTNYGFECLERKVLNSKKEPHNEYFLFPSTMYDNFAVINKYRSKVLCEIDRESLYNILNSTKNENIQYKTAGSYLAFLWYIAAFVFLVLGFIILFGGKSITEEEANQLKKNNQGYEKFKKYSNELPQKIQELDNTAFNNYNKINDIINNIRRFTGM